MVHKSKGAKVEFLNERLKCTKILIGKLNPFTKWLLDLSKEIADKSKQIRFAIGFLLFQWKLYSTIPLTRILMKTANSSDLANVRDTRGFDYGPQIHGWQEIRAIKRMSGVTQGPGSELMVFYCSVKLIKCTI